MTACGPSVIIRSARAIAARSNAGGAADGAAGSLSAGGHVTDNKVYSPVGSALVTIQAVIIGKSPGGDYDGAARRLTKVNAHGVYFRGAPPIKPVHFIGRNTGHRIEAMALTDGARTRKDGQGRKQGQRETRGKRRRKYRQSGPSCYHGYI